MTTLFYRGHDYVQHKEPAVKACSELTYRREHYNTCRETIGTDFHSTFSYRGTKYAK